MAFASEHRETRAAMNQMLFRDVNERVKKLNEGFTLFTPLGEWICECANDACTEKVEMSAVEYEKIRSEGTRPKLWCGPYRVSFSWSSCFGS